MKTSELPGISVSRAPDEPAGARLRRAQREARVAGALEHDRREVRVALAVDVLPGPCGQQVGRLAQPRVRLGRLQTPGGEPQVHPVECPAGTPG